MGWWGLMPYAPLLQEFLDCMWGKLSTIVWPYNIWNGGSAKEVCHDLYQFKWLGVVPHVYNFWPVSLAVHDDQKFFATVARKIHWYLLEWPVRAWFLYQRFWLLPWESVLTMFASWYKVFYILIHAWPIHGQKCSLFGAMNSLMCLM